LPVNDAATFALAAATSSVTFGAALAPKPKNLAIAAPIPSSIS
jgi:hypothetical protein